MISKKIKRYSKFILFILISAYLIKESLGNGDFKVFLEAAKLIANGETPYGEWIFVSEGNYAEYFYSPFWALLLIPFSYVPSYIPNMIWLILNVFFLYRSWKLISKYYSSLNLTKRQLNLILIFVAALSFRFILYNFGMLQMSIFLLWGILESVNLNSKKRFLIAGFLVALIINIKVLPIILIPYFIYRVQFKIVFVAFFFSFVLLIFPSIFLGWSFNNQLISDWFIFINPANSEHLIELKFGAHSLTALLPTLLMKTEGTFPYLRNITSLDTESVLFIINLIRLSLVCSVLFFLKKPGPPHFKTNLHQIKELSYLMLLIPLIFPRQQKYAFLLALPAQTYLLYFLTYTFQFKQTFKLKWYTILACVILSFILMTLTTDGIIGRELNRISQHYKTITYGALLLIPALFLAQEKYFHVKVESDKI